MENMNTNDLPWYLQEYAEPVKPETWEKMDEEARTFQVEFIPKYLKYAGTKSLLRHIREYINTHEIKRRNDFRFQLICMWCWHIQYYRERHGIKFEPWDVFKIRIPKLILEIQ